MPGQSIRAGRAFVELFADDTRLTRGLRQAQRRLRSFGRGIGSIGRSISGVGLAAAGAFVPAVTTFANFDKTMSKVAAVTGVTGDAFDQLRAKAKELGESTAFSASQAAEGMVALGQAGFSAQQILAGIGPTLSLAQAGALELGEAADIASDVGGAFGLAAEEIARVADVFSVVATSANTDVQKLGETMKFAAPLAAIVGQELEVTAAAAGILGNNGIKATQAGTDLAQIFKKLGETNVQKKFRELGVEVTDAGGKFRDFDEIISDLSEATAQLSEQGRLELFKEFDRATKSIAILTDNARGLEQLTQKTEDANGAAEKLGNTMLDNLAGDATAALSALEGALIAIGEALNETLRNTTTEITEVIRSITSWIRKNQDVIVTIAKVSAGTLVAGAALTALGVAVTALSVAIGSTVTVFGAASAAITAAAAAIAALVSPIGLAVAAIAGLGIAIESQTGIVASAVESIKEQFSGVSSTVTRTIEAIRIALASGNFKRAAEVGLAGLKAAFAESMRKIADVLFDVANNFVTAFEIAWVKIRELFQQNIVDLGTQAAVAAERIKAELSGEDDRLNVRITAIEQFGEAAKRVIAANTAAELEGIERAAAAREKLFDAFLPALGAGPIGEFERLLEKISFEDQIQAARDFFSSFRLPGLDEINATVDKLKQAQQESTAAAAAAVEGSGRGTFNAAAVRALFGGGGGAVSVDQTQRAIEKNTAETNEGITKVVTAVKDVATKLVGALEFS